MNRRIIIAQFLLIFSLCFYSFSDIINDKKIELHGMAATENGEFIKNSYDQKTWPDRIWINKEYGQIYLKVSVNDHFDIVLNPEIMLWFDTYAWQKMGNNAFGSPFTQHTTASIAEGQGILKYGDSENVAVKFAAGVIPYKYNGDAKNLGEYLFRTGARPSYIVTSFDYAYARLSGLRINSTINKNLSLDLFLTTEIQAIPTLDWSISALIGYKIPSFIDLGAGIMLDRFFPIKGSVESPEVETNSYYSSSGEKKYFSFGGIKLMGRISVDPKGLLPPDIAGIFGKEDGKIYSEAAILGTQNIKAYTWMKVNPTDLDSTLVVDSSKNYYADIKQRIPIMFGFTVPTFKFLDYLSIEGEYFSWPYPNSYGDYSTFREMLPQPTQIKNYSKQDYIDDNWKFSINAKKNISSCFSVIGQIARDHTHHDIYYVTYNDLSEAFTQKDQWGWWLKLQYKF
jgi:uncharacterized protein involved in tolerance to divalent cations